MPIPPQDRRPALRPPQFRLSTLFWVIAFLCAVLAALGMVGPLGAFALIMLILLMLAHVWGNALGVRLRSNGDFPVDDQDRPLERSATVAREDLNPSPPMRLRERKRLRWVLAIAFAFMVLSGVGGAWWSLRASERTVSVQDVALNAAAFGVLGGIWGLLGGGFLVVGVGAWREALRGAQRSDPPNECR